MFLSHTCAHMHTHTHTRTKQNSVPHLKTRLQLQQAIMKELLQRQAADKQQQNDTTKQPAQAPSIAATSASTAASSSSKLPQLPLTVQGNSVVASKVPSVSSVHASTADVQVTSLQQQQKQKTSNVSDPIIIPATSNSSASIVVGAGQLTPALQQQLSTVLNSPAVQQQVLNQLPKNIREQVAKLPLEQQKFVYAHHLRRLQMLKLQSQQNNSSGSTASDNQSANKTSATSGGAQMFPSHSTATATVVASPQMVMEKQQQLVKQQQGAFVLGGGKGTFGVGKSGGQGSAGKASQLLTTGGKTSFVNMKLAPGGQATPSSSPSKKEKAKGSKHKDGATGEEWVIDFVCICVSCIHGSLRACLIAFVQVSWAHSVSCYKLTHAKCAKRGWQNRGCSSCASVVWPVRPTPSLPFIMLSLTPPPRK